MFLSNASVRRPVAMCALIIALLLLGLNAYRKMGVENMPQMDVPFVTVVTVYPGATPSEIETDIAKKIEDAIASVDGLKHATSSCMENVCQMTLEFEMGVDVDIAAVDVREQLDLIQEELPLAAERPKVLKFDINAKPIVNLGLTGSAPLDTLYDYADNELSDRISTIAGVAEVQTIGGAELEVHVLVDRLALASKGLTTADISRALGENIGKIPSGRVQGNGSEYMVTFDADVKAIDDIGEIELFSVDGSRCYIRDVARIRMGTEERRQAAYVDGSEGVVLRVVKKADANAVELAQRIRAVVEKVRTNLPGGMALTWISDDGDFIQASVDTGVINIWQGVLLTAAVLLLFLHNLRSTIVVTITMPLTVVISLFFMRQLNYTLNMSTLLAIAMSVGILVTNAIVVLESIVSQLAGGHAPKEAARRGAGNVAIAVLASVGTNVVVLFPIAMLTGKIGPFLRPFALTMVVATVVSLLVSFTVTPILSSKLLRPAGTRKGREWFGWFTRSWNRAFAAVENAYERTLRFNERHKWAAILVVAGCAAMVAHALSLAPKVGFTFMSNNDQADLLVKLEFPTRYDLNRTIARTREAERLLSQLPEVRHVFTTTGKVEGVIGKSSEGVYLSQISVRFSSKVERTESMQSLLNRARGLLANFPDAIITVNAPSVIGGQSSPIELEIAGDDLAELDRLAVDVTALARQVEGVADVDPTTRYGKPELKIRPNRAVLADVGLPAMALGRTMRGNIEGLEAATYKRGDRSYDIRVKYVPEQGTTQVAAMLLPGPVGQPVVLPTVADLREERAPVQITRKNKRRISKVYANLVGSMPLGTAVDAISAKIDEADILPTGYEYGFAGEYEIMQETGAGFAEAGLTAMVLTYLLLAAILESFSKPIIILATIPLGLAGVLWGLYLGGESMSMFAMLGMVMLIGIVVNNAILIMGEVANLHDRGEGTHDAMIHAAKSQFRPILMITLAAVLGMLPLAIGRGLGSESRVGIGYASIGGILVSGLLTLVLIPVLYDLMTRKKKTPHGPNDA